MERLKENFYRRKRGRTWVFERCGKRGAFRKATDRKEGGKKGPLFIGKKRRREL